MCPTKASEAKSCANTHIRWAWKGFPSASFEMTMAPANTLLIASERQWVRLLAKLLLNSWPIETVRYNLSVYLSCCFKLLSVDVICYRAIDSINNTNPKWVTTNKRRMDKLKYVVVHLPSCVQLFVTLWTVACQASLSFTISQSLIKFMFTELVMLLKL